MLDVEPIAVFHRVFVDELPTVIGNYDPWYVVSCDDVTPYELAYLLIGNGTQRFCFYVFGKVVNGYNNELPLTFGRREWPEKVHSPHIKRQYCLYTGQVVRRCPVYLGEILTLVIASNDVLRVFIDGRPVVSASEDFVDNCSYPLINATSSLMYLTDYVIPFFGSYTFQQRVSVGFFVEHSLV